MKILSGVITILLLGFTQPCLAVDKSVYYGNWQGKAGNKQISITLKKRKITVSIDNKTINQPIKYEYTYSKVSPYPFLSMIFNDEKQTEHLIYVVIGTETNDNKTRLSGFYETSRIIPDSHGKLESVTYRLEMVQLTRQRKD